MVGDIIKIHEDEFLPADVMIISTSDNSTGKCFIETKNLDGETNLKQKCANKELIKVVHTNTEVNFEFEEPNALIYKFNGMII